MKETTACLNSYTKLRRAQFEELAKHDLHFHDLTNTTLINTPRKIPLATEPLRLVLFHLVVKDRGVFVLA